MKLERNPDYWDAPRPYLDSLELRAVSDANQRVNMMVSGGADLASESSWAALAKADQAGLVTDAVPVGGGQYLVMNTRRAPFDDPRAREAVSAAVNLDDINTAVFEGHGEVPDTLFPESSPFHADIPLRQDDPERAQQLFDELAAEGKPVEFTFTATSLVEIRSVAESLQAQLAAYDNVDVQVEVLDIAGYMPRTAARDFDMIIWPRTVPNRHHVVERLPFHVVGKSHRHLRPRIGRRPRRRSHGHLGRGTRGRLSHGAGTARRARTGDLVHPIRTVGDQ